MALQQINWTQIDSVTVPSGSIIDIGSLNDPLHIGYFEDLYVSGFPVADYLDNQELNQYTASLKEAIETTGSNLTVIGDLLVKGTTTTINSTIVELDTNILSINGSGNNFGGIQVNDPINPNKISGSIVWDSNNDYWIAGTSGSEQKVILNSDLDAGIWRETGSFFATTNDLQVTGSMLIKGDLRVEGKTTLIQTLDPSVESLVVSGAMSIVMNQINSEIISASLFLENLGIIGDRNGNYIIDCGDGFTN